MSRFQDSASPLDSKGRASLPGEAHTRELLVSYDEQWNYDIG